MIALKIEKYIDLNKDFRISNIFDNIIDYKFLITIFKS
jgi:hypothetical protein